MPILDINDSNSVSSSRREDITTRKYRSQEEMGTSTLFAKDHDLDTIVSYISGLKWSITYFYQSNRPNDDYTKLDINVPATIQKYHRINNLLVYLQSGIEQVSPSEIEGEFIINAGFLPLNYDVFIATLTGGREAIFNITEVESRIYNNRHVYYCKFKFVIFVDNDKDLYNNLLFKTVKEYIYDKEYLLNYSNPVLLASDYNAKLDFKDKYTEIVDYYFETFIHPSKNTLSPPTVSGIYTDTMLTDFIFKIVNQEDSDKLYKLTRMDPDKIDKPITTIWDAIINRDASMLKRCKKEIGFKYIPFTTNSLRARSFNYLGVKFLASEIHKGEAAIEPTYMDISTLLDYYPDYYNKKEKIQEDKQDGHESTTNIGTNGVSSNTVDVNKKDKEINNKVLNSVNSNITDNELKYTSKILKSYDTIYWNSSTEEEQGKVFGPLINNKVLEIQSNVNKLDIKVLPNTSYKDVSKFTKSITPIIEQKQDIYSITLKAIHNSKAKYPDTDYFNIRIKFLDKDNNEVIQYTDYKIKIMYMESPYIEEDNSSVNKEQPSENIVTTYNVNAPILFPNVPTINKHRAINDTILPSINTHEDVAKVISNTRELNTTNSALRPKLIEVYKPIKDITDKDNVVIESEFKSVYKEPIDDLLTDNSIPVITYQDEYIPPIKFPDNYYVLSVNFYNQDLGKLGILEKCLLQYFRSEIINKDILSILTRQYHMWNTKDQYYLIPILLVLLKDTINNIYKTL